MRVALIQETVSLARGGAETSTIEMARALAALGLNVYIVCAGDQVAPYLDHNVTFLPIPVRGPTRALRTYRYAQAALRVCRREHFDVVHAITPCLAAHVYQPRGGTYPETIARTLARTPTILRPAKALGRMLNLRQRFLLQLERKLLGRPRRTVYVAAVSDYVRRQVIEGYGVPAERVRVVFNGVDYEPLPEADAHAQRAALRTALGLTADTPLLLFVAHNFPLKGLGELIAALDAARSDGWHVIVAGRDDPRPYERRLQKLGLSDRVRFAGTQTPVRAWHAAADALAHPTWYDPCSRVVLEALCAGLPVVTTRYNGAAEAMDLRRHGAVITEPNDTPALVAGLRRALSPDVRATARVDGPALCRRLSMPRHARELLSLYETVVSAAR